MEDRKIFELTPLPVARGYRRYRNALEVRDRHDAAYYLFEIYLKLVSSFVIASYLDQDERDHRVNATLKGLARPSLGEWLRFLRECLDFLLRRKEVDPGIRALGELHDRKESRWSEVLRLFNGLRSFLRGGSGGKEQVSLQMLLGELVAYRNRVIGHGAPLDPEHYKKFADLFGSAFPDLLKESPFLTVRRLISFDSVLVQQASTVECRVIEYMGLQPIRRAAPHVLPYGAPAPCQDALYLMNADGALLPLSPFLCAHKEDVFFLNEAGGTLEYLSYSTGERHQPSGMEDAREKLFERILGYRVDEAQLSRIEDDVAPDGEETTPAAATGLQKLGNYRVLREIGRGAMGIVLEAVQESLGRRVALKVLPGSFSLDPRRVERFHREARAAAKVHHPNIVPVYEVGEEGGNHFYAMEYIDGPSLQEFLAKARHEPRSQPVGQGSATSDPKYIARSVEQIAALAEGLDVTHRLGLIHRDIKPSNILIDPSGRFVLADFGLVHEAEAKTLTRSGEMLGTLAYMPPEQVSRRRVDLRADVYSLGATLYECLTLRLPFDGQSDLEIQNAILFEDPVRPRKLNPRLNRDLETIILHAMEKNPERRYLSAGELSADLRRLLRYESVKARPTGMVRRGANWLRRHKTLATAALAISLAIASFGGWSFLVSVQKHREKSRWMAQGDSRFENGEFPEARQAYLRAFALDSADRALELKLAGCETAGRKAQAREMASRADQVASAFRDLKKQREEGRIRALELSNKIPSWAPREEKEVLLKSEESFRLLARDVERPLAMPSPHTWGRWGWTPAWPAPARVLPIWPGPASWKRRRIRVRVCPRGPLLFRRRSGSSGLFPRSGGGPGRLLHLQAGGQPPELCRVLERAERPGAAAGRAGSLGPHELAPERRQVHGSSGISGEADQGYQLECGRCLYYVAHGASAGARRESALPSSHGEGVGKGRPGR